jgi:hypothetical protein
MIAAGRGFSKNESSAEKYLTFDNNVAIIILLLE